MNGVDEIVDRVEADLAQEPKKVNARRRKIARLAEIRDAWECPDARLRSREHAVFTVDQTRMMKMEREVCLKLLVRGHHVANVDANDAGQWTMTARPEIESKVAHSVKSGLPWSKDPVAAKAIREFIRVCAEKLGKAPELQVQLQLISLLRAGRSGKPAALANLAPVLPFRFPTEIATVVNSAGVPATGNIDILARTVKGSRGEFVVLELKKPYGLSKPDVAKAFEQAIQYAAALRYEARAPFAVSYRRLYGPNPPRARPAPSYENLPDLTAHAVVVLPAQCKVHATACLAALGTHSADNSIGVGALLYRAEKIQNLWKLDENENSFEWLTPGWRP